MIRLCKYIDTTIFRSDEVPFIVSEYHFTAALDELLGRAGSGEILLKKIQFTVRKVSKGDSLHHIGDEVSSLYCVMSGWLTSSRELANGDRQILGFHVPFDLVGFEYLGRADAVSTLTAYEETSVISIPIGSLKKAIEGMPGGAMAIASMLSRRLAAAQTRLCVFSNGKAHVKLAHLFHGLRSKQIRRGVTDYNVLNIPFTQSDIADLLGMTNVTVNRQMKRLREENCVSFKSGKIVILDYERLMSFSDGLIDSTVAVDEFD